MGDGVQRHASTALPPEKRPGTHFIEGWVGLRAGLDGCGKPRPDWDSIRPARSESLYRLSYPGLHYYYYYYYLMQSGCYPVAVVILHVHKI